MIFGFGKKRSVGKKPNPRARESTYFTYRYNPEDHDGATADAVRALIDSIILNPYEIVGLGYAIPLSVVQKVLKVWVNVDLELITETEKRRREEERTPKETIGDTDVDQAATGTEE